MNPVLRAVYGFINRTGLVTQIAIGFVISVVQDSAETALNSSTDVLLTAAGCPGEVDEGQMKASEVTA